MRILVIVPTRGRPDNIVRLDKALLDTQVDVEVMYCVDDDDPALADYVRTGIPLMIGPRKRLVGTLNDVAKQFVDDYDIIGFLGDDVVPKTHRWDNVIRDNFKPNMVAYGNDGWQGEGLPTGVFLDARIVSVLGYMVVPTLIHLFADNYWKALGEALGTLTYLPGVDMEHMHPYAGKAEHDQTYEEANAGPVWEHDEKAFHWYVEHELAFDVEILGINE
ncbi:glycosyltransferase [Streptomyces phage Francob]